MNTGLWRVYWLNQPRLPITRVRNPAAKSLFYDEDDSADDGAFWYQTASDNLADHHMGRGNIAYFDGHVDLEYPPFAHEQPHNDPRY
jgi:prepilin-type processing-associated H-X9-DG protein